MREIGKSEGKGKQPAPGLGEREEKQSEPCRGTGVCVFLTVREMHVTPLWGGWETPAEGPPARLVSCASALLWGVLGLRKVYTKQLPGIVKIWKGGMKSFKTDSETDFWGQILMFHPFDLLSLPTTDAPTKAVTGSQPMRLGSALPEEPGAFRFSRLWCNSRPPGHFPSALWETCIFTKQLVTICQAIHPLPFHLYISFCGYN